jgi:hypothetical protein
MGQNCIGLWVNKTFNDFGRIAVTLSAICGVQTAYLRRQIV